MPNPGVTMFNEPEIDEKQFEGKSLEEIRAMEQAAIKAAENAQPTQDRPRNEKGQFVSPNGEIDNAQDDPANAEDPDPAAAAADGDPDKVIYRREIPNGDTIDVYEAESVEELLDKIANGKANANKKIHELSRKVQAQPPEKSYTEEEEFVLSQELMAKPTEGFKKLFKETTGFDISDFKSKLQRVEAFEAAQRSNAIQQAFVESHPDYVANPTNGKLIAKQCELNGDKEFTAEGLHKAYLELKSRGLLELRAEGADADTQPTPDTKQKTTASQTDVTQQRSRRSSTITSRGRTTPIKTEPTEDELYSMPMDKLRDLANRQLAEQ